MTTRNTAAISKLSDWVRSSAWEGRIVPAACLNYDEFDQRYVVNEPATRQRSRLLEQLQPSQRSLTSLGSYPLDRKVSPPLSILRWGVSMAPDPGERDGSAIAPVPEWGRRPLWSVMIPTFNSAKYLRETLGSVLAQDPGPERMQIEVVDAARPRTTG